MKEDPSLCLDINSFPVPNVPNGMIENNKDAFSVSFPKLGSIRSFEGCLCSFGFEALEAYMRILL